MSEERLVIEPADRGNPLWPRIERHLKRRLEMLRAQNEGDQSETKTANLRGRIAELKALLACANDTPNIED